MTREDKSELREWRDSAEDEADKRLLRKTIAYMEDLEHRLQSIGVFTRSILNEVKGRNHD